jgi:L-asparaginase/Glu-tRNA(Gln) amidotransferase subunit D
VDLETYELGAMAAAEGAISAGHHTRWAALAKLGLLLGAGGGLEEARAAFSLSWAGEPL